MTTLTHLNDLEYVSGDDTIKVHLHDGRLYFQVRDDSTGNYNTPRVIQDKDILIIKDMYGGNGYDTNLCVKFGVTFDDAYPYQLNTPNKQALMKLLSTDNAIVAEMMLDTSSGGHAGINIIFTVAYDPNGDHHSDAYELLDKIVLPNMLSQLFSTAPAPFNSSSALLERFDITPKVLHKNVPASIIRVELSNDGTVKVISVGSYDHISMKYNTQDDNQLVRIREKNVIQHTYTGVDVNNIKKLYVYLNDKNYQILYRYEAAVVSGSIDSSTILKKSTKNNYY